MLKLVKPATIQVREILQHPAVLFGLVLLGGWTGLMWPAHAGAYAAVAALYLALVQMAAYPFVLLAVYFGLQRLTGLDQARRLLGQLLGVSVAATLACAVLGVLVASLSGTGADLSASQVNAFGHLALRQEGGLALALHGSEAAPAAPWNASALVPGNLFGALAYGAMPAVLVAVMLFGWAVASQGAGAAGALNAILEACYRALESLVHRFNHLLPVAAFLLAATATAAAGADTIVLLGGFLAVFLAVTGALCAALIGLISYRLRTSPFKVLVALREPLTVCLFSPAAVAAIPGLIASMSDRLGYSRGLVELCAPIAPAFVKAGEALFFAVLAVFVAHLYGVPLGVAGSAHICLMAFAAAWLSIGIVGAKSVVLGSYMLAWLGLPLEALLPVFMLVEVLCEGARNLLSLLVAAGLIALVAEGLYIDEAQESQALHIAFSRAQLLLVTGLILAALASVFSAGLGAGLMKAF